MNGQKHPVRNPAAEAGNVLFLILIAVALFAALSYAMVQSGRNSGSVDRETTAILAGQVIGTPSLVRQSVNRMIVLGTPASSLIFTGDGSTNDVLGVAGSAGVKAPPTACTAPCAAWAYKTFTDTTHGLFVGGVKTDAPEILAVLPDVTDAVCAQLQKIQGFASTTPPVQDTAEFDWTDITGAISQVGGLKGSATTIWEATLTGQEFACVDNRGDGNFYYHVLLDQ